MCVEIETYTTCYMHEMCVLRKFSEKNFKGVLHPRPVFWLFMHFSQKLKHIGNK